MTEVTAATLALGRILRLASRPAEPGDVEDYERCRRIILETIDPAYRVTADNAPNWTRDRNNGAQGD